MIGDKRTSPTKSGRARKTPPFDSRVNSNAIIVCTWYVFLLRTKFCLSSHAKIMRHSHSSSQSKLLSHQPSSFFASSLQKKTSIATSQAYLLLCLASREIINMGIQLIFLALTVAFASAYTPISTRHRQSGRLTVQMVSTSNNAKTSKFPRTPPSKYPTMRGTTVDSRKIIATGAGRQHLTAIRLAHILFASEELAQSSLHELRAATISFEELARQISLCSGTREEGGSIGWISVRDPDGSKNEHLDEIFPRDAREQAIQITTKPGDIVMVGSTRGFHLVQVVDVMADVRKMASVKQRRKSKKPRNQVGILSGALTSEESSESKDLTYKLETMGCQMNIADSERIEGQLQSLGIRPLDEENDKLVDPDVVVLNTCSIREHAESKVYSYLGPHAKRKRDGDDVAIVVAGCVAQQQGEELLRRVPEVDLVMGPQYANRIADLLEDVSNGNQVVATEATHIMEDSSKPRRGSKVAAWVNVIYGCNERCAFCIVPTTRGVEQSRPLESIVQEVEELVSKGYKEVTLLGQNIE